MRVVGRRMVPMIGLHVLLCGCIGLSSMQGSECQEAPEVSGPKTVTIREGMKLNTEDFLSERTMQTCSARVVTGALDTDQAGIYPVTLTVVGRNGGITIRSVFVSVLSASELGAPDSSFKALSEDSEAGMKKNNKNNEEENTHEDMNAKSSNEIGTEQRIDSPKADPYTAEKEHCLETYGTWQGTYCTWTTPASDPAGNEDAGRHAQPDISGGTTSCWDYIGEDGRSYHECEWVSDWEEY